MEVLAHMGYCRIAGWLCTIQRRKMRVSVAARLERHDTRSQISGMRGWGCGPTPLSLLPPPPECRTCYKLRVIRLHDTRHCWTRRTRLSRNLP